MSSYSPYTWLARLGQGLNKFTDQLTGQVLQLNSTPDSVSQEGTPFSVDRMNAIEQGLATHTHTAAEIPTGGFSASRITSGILPVARGGTGVSSLSTLISNLKLARIYVGSYTGSGTYGQSTPTTITATFPPKLAVIWHNDSGLNMYSDDWEDSFIWTYPQSRGTIRIGGSDAQNTFSTSGNSLQFYNTESASLQLNSSGQTYYFIILG